MKKLSKPTKLSLSTETIRQLDGTQLQQAAGGATLTCLNTCNVTCGLQNTCYATCATCFCTTNTQYPCASGGQHGC